MRHTVLAAIAGLSVVALAPAGATTYVVNGPTGMVMAPGAYSLTPATVTADASYTDTFVFTLTTASALTASNLSTIANSATGANLNFSTSPGINGVQLRQFNQTYGTVGLQLLATTNTNATLLNSSAVQTYAFAPGSNVNGTETMNISGITLAAGSYAIIVNYSVVGAPATYNGNINFAAVAAPEPATWGMMLLGFGLVGAAARRSRRIATVLA